MSKKGFTPAKSMLGFTTKNINERLQEGSLLEVKYE
jgi:hypothetical protein